ncbi:hypothetical protein GCM10023313_15720 [Mucilaginibacter defluvii]|uniref:PKD domain-containing protein n=2 Tax=Mucilaginibacter defluvii TaxID=1196019 RepID=A0ABP9FRZ5_9SPHI
MNMKAFYRISSAIVLVAMLSVGCKKEKAETKPEPELPRPVADFSVEVPDTLEYNKFKFTSNSTDFESLLWQFGDDSTSTDPNPMHKYEFDDNYKVNLTVRNKQGFTSSREIILRVADPNFDPTKIGPSYFKTIGGTLWVSRDNGGGPDGGEGSKKVVDDNPNSKFLQSGFAGDLVIKFTLDSAVVAGGYTLVSGNDAPDRNPRNWEVQGSEDDVKWITLESAAASNNPNSVNYKWFFTAPNQRKFWHFKRNNTAYKYYRLRVKSNWGSRDFQLSEWSINKKQPD